MTLEQKTIARRLGIVGAVLLIVIAVVYFVYAPKEQAGPVRLYPSGQKKSIAAVFRAGAWYVDSNASGKLESPGGDSVFTLGAAGDTPLTGTWDVADGPSVGVFRDGVFTLMFKSGPQKFTFGSAGDTPIVGDWTGDGRTKIGVFRKGFWLLDLNGNFKWDGEAVDRLINLGGDAGEIPLVGDWNGDGKSDIGIYRPDKALFALDANGNGAWDKSDKLFNFGGVGEVPIVGDWNGDGRSKVGTFRVGFWALDANGNQAWDGAGKDKFIALGGTPGDIPVIGDWNGDGRTKVGVYRQGMWYVDTDGNGSLDKTDIGWQLGLAGDIPMLLTPIPTRK